MMKKESVRSNRNQHGSTGRNIFFVMLCSSWSALLLLPMVFLLLNFEVDRSEAIGMPSGGGGGGCCCPCCCCGGGGYGGGGFGGFGGFGGGCGGRRRKREISPSNALAEIKPHLKSGQDVPCPQPEWKHIIETNQVANDVQGSVERIQTALHNRFPELRFLVFCSKSSAPEMDGKSTALQNDVGGLFLSRGDAYCSTELDFFNNNTGGERKAETNHSIVSGDNGKRSTKLSCHVAALVA